MPHSDFNEADKPWKQLQTLKRGRGVELRLPSGAAPPCASKHCMHAAHDPASELHAECYCSSSSDSPKLLALSRSSGSSSSNSNSFNHDDASFGTFADEFDEDFELGPPPPTGPVLFRQKAMDFTATAEAKMMSQALEAKAATASPPLSRAMRSSVLRASQARAFLLH